MLLVLINKGKGMQSSSEQPLVGEERYVTTLITAAKETIGQAESDSYAVNKQLFYIPINFEFLAHSSQSKSRKNFLSEQVDRCGLKTNMDEINMKLT